MGDDGGEGEFLSSIYVKEVKGLTSILDFDSKDQNYRGYLASREAWSKVPTTIIENAAKEHFYRFIKSYLEDIEIKLKTPHTPLNSFNLVGIKQNEKEVSFEGEELEIRAPGAKTPLVVYCPKITFKTYPREITAKSALESEWGMEYESGHEIMADLLSEAIYNLKNRKKPLITTPKDTYMIRIANIEYVPRIINALEKISETASFDLEDLVEIKTAMKSSDVKGAALMTLEGEYEDRMRKTIPKKFSF